MYFLFDASPSSSDVIREGYREAALLMGSSFCNRFRGRGEIELNAITANPAQDSLLTTLACPNGANETDQQTQNIAFQRTFSAAIDSVIAYQAPETGTDVVGSALQAAKQTFSAISAKQKYLMVFSDMQQSGGGLRNCVLERRFRSASCLKLYFEQNPDARQRNALSGVEVYVSGAGRNIRGTVTRDEWQADVSFWRGFFNSEGARVCWYAATSVPVQVRADGTKALDSNYFNDSCRSAI